MAEYAEVENGVCVNVVIADAGWVSGQLGTWVDITGEAGVGIGWQWDGSVWTEPAPPPPQYVLTGSEWVERFTDDEWQWLKTQRNIDPPTNASKQLDKLMDAIRWTNSVDVSAASMDPFYNWLLNNGIPGGQTRIDELRAPV